MPIIRNHSGLGWIGSAAALVTGVWAMSSLRTKSRNREISKGSPVVLITGGGRGLGFAIALEWAKRGARLSLCARDRQELELAHQKLSALGAEVAIFTSDLTKKVQIQRWLAGTLRRYGRIDVLVNNAGVIEVGSLETLDEFAFRSVVESNLWSMVRTSLLALPHMRDGGRIINITSIGAAVSVPHLLTYSVSKFGALGFSMGLDAELDRRAISVTSVLPGLMRTGSAIHAKFRGDHSKEFAWFSVSSGLPGLAVSASSAARQIVAAGIARKRFVVIGIPAKMLRLAQVLFPNVVLGALRLANRLLPEAQGVPHQVSVPGWKIGDNAIFARGAAERLNEKIAA